MQHTTPAICVQKNGKDELYVLDLSLFKTPVPIAEWKEKLTGDMDPALYLYYSTSMYSMSSGSKDISPEKAFSQDNRNVVDQFLSQDWAGHLLFLKYSK